MVDFSTLTPENINMFAMKHYDNPTCVDEKEFLDDMKRFKYLKRLFRKYQTSNGKELKERLGINHIIIIANVFVVVFVLRLIVHLPLHLFLLWVLRVGRIYVCFRCCFYLSKNVKTEKTRKEF